MSDACVITTKEEIAKLLGLAFDEGWDGYYDLRESVIEKLLSKFLEERERRLMPEGHFDPPPPSTITTIRGASGTIDYAGLDCGPLYAPHAVGSGSTSSFTNTTSSSVEAGNMPFPFEEWVVAHDPSLTSNTA